MSEKYFVADVEEILPTVNDSPYKRIIAIGDVHGKFNKLKSLWRKISVTEEDLVIFLGDYIDRGEGVAAVLAWVMTLKSKRKNFIFLRGNHEQMMLNVFKHDREFLEELLDGKRRTLTTRDALEHEPTALWVINGGKYTLAGLNALLQNNIFTLDDVLNFVESLPLSHSSEIGGRKYLFCHAGVNPSVSFEEQTEEDLLWIREKFFDNYAGNDVIISGHSPVQAFFDFEGKAPYPIKIPGKNILMTDTGSFLPDGKISAVDILSGEYWQSGLGNFGGSDDV